MPVHVSTIDEAAIQALGNEFIQLANDLYTMGQDVTSQLASAGWSGDGHTAATAAWAYIVQNAITPTADGLADVGEAIQSFAAWVAEKKAEQAKQQLIEIFSGIAMVVLLPLDFAIAPLLGVVAGVVGRLVGNLVRIVVDTTRVIEVAAAFEAILPVTLRGLTPLVTAIGDRSIVALQNITRGVVTTGVEAGLNGGVALGESIGVQAATSKIAGVDWNPSMINWGVEAAFAGAAGILAPAARFLDPLPHSGIRPGSETPGAPVPVPVNGERVFVPPAPLDPKVGPVRAPDGFAVPPLDTSTKVTSVHLPADFSGAVRSGSVDQISLPPSRLGPETPATLSGPASGTKPLGTGVGPTGGHPEPLVSGGKGESGTVPGRIGPDAGTLPKEKALATGINGPTSSRTIPDGQDLASRTSHSDLRDGSLGSPNGSVRTSVSTRPVSDPHPVGTPLSQFDAHHLPLPHDGMTSAGPSTMHGGRQPVLGAGTEWIRQPDGWHIATEPGSLRLGTGLDGELVVIPPGSRAVFDGSGELRLVVSHDGPSYHVDLNGQWSTGQTGGLIVKKITDPVSLRLADGDRTVTIGKGEEIVDTGTGKSVAYREHGGEVAQDRTFVRLADDRWAVKPTQPEVVEAWLAGANGEHETARLMLDIARRSGPQIPFGQRLVNVDEARLGELLHGSHDDAAAAMYEMIRRASGKSLRWTQLAASDAFLDGRMVNMAAGEGKSLAYLHYVGRNVFRGDGDAMQVITTRDNLAAREFEIYQAMFEPHGVAVTRMTPDGVGPSVGDGKGHKTIYIGTSNDVAFSHLRDKSIPGRTVLIDEVDEVFIYSNPTYIISKGVTGSAPLHVVQEVQGAHAFLQSHLRDGSLTEADFGRTPGQVGGRAALTESGMAKLAAIHGEPLSPTLRKRLDMAATAHWEYVENTHYIVARGRVLIVDQYTHALMVDLEASAESVVSESRWNGGLAQALEAKHGLTIRADPANSKSVTPTQLFTAPQYDVVVGASGTVAGKTHVFQQRLGMSGGISEVPRYYRSELTGHPDAVFENNDSKLDAIASDTLRMRAGDGTTASRPQLILVHDNKLVGELSTRLTKLGIDHEAIDARWFWDKGHTAEREFQAIVNRAGQAGQVTVINMQGARGVDIPVSAEAQSLGGLHVRITARSALSHDIDIQAENRTARSGQPGSVQYYISPEDDLFRLSHNENVDLAVIRYTDAVTVGQANRTAIEQAATALRELVPSLQDHPSVRPGIQTPLTQQANAPPVHTSANGVTGPAFAHEPQPPPRTGADTSMLNDPAYRSILESVRWAAGRLITAGHAQVLVLPGANRDALAAWAYQIQAQAMAEPGTRWVVVGGTASGASLEAAVSEAVRALTSSGDGRPLRLVAASAEVTTLVARIAAGVTAVTGTAVGLSGPTEGAMPELVSHAVTADPGQLEARLGKADAAAFAQAMIVASPMAQTIVPRRPVIGVPADPGAVQAHKVAVVRIAYALLRGGPEAAEQVRQQLWKRAGRPPIAPRRLGGVSSSEVDGSAASGSGLPSGHAGITSSVPTSTPAQEPAMPVKDDAEAERPAQARRPYVLPNLGGFSPLIEPDPVYLDLDSQRLREHLFDTVDQLRPGLIVRRGLGTEAQRRNEIALRAALVRLRHGEQWRSLFGDGITVDLRDDKQPDTIITVRIRASLGELMPQALPLTLPGPLRRVAGSLWDKRTHRADVRFSISARARTPLTSGAGEDERFRPHGGDLLFANAFVADLPVLAGVADSAPTAQRTPVIRADGDKDPPPLPKPIGFTKTAKAIDVDVPGAVLGEAARRALTGLPAERFPDSTIDQWLSRESLRAAVQQHLDTGLPVELSLAGTGSTPPAWLRLDVELGSARPMASLARRQGPSEAVFADARFTITGSVSKLGPDAGPPTSVSVVVDAPASVAVLADRSDAKVILGSAATPRPSARSSGWLPSRARLRAQARAVAALRAGLPRRRRYAYPDQQLRDLVWLARDMFGAEAPTNLHSYDSMVSRLLGRDDGATPANLVSLLDLVAGAYTLPTWHRLTRAAPRLARARLVDLALQRSWSTHARPVEGQPSTRPRLVEAPPSDATTVPTELTPAELVPGLQYLSELSNLEELRDWVLGLLPVPGGDLSIDRLRSSLTWGFTAALDEGVPVKVVAGDQTYVVTLFLDVTGLPAKETGVKPSARLETRINVIDERLRSGSRGWTGYGEVGLAGRFGTRTAATLAVLFSVGGSRTKARTLASNVGGANYTYFKPSDPVGSMWVPVSVSAVVTRDGRTEPYWRAATWREPKGKGPQEFAKLYVGESQMPQSGPPPRQQLANPLPLWDMHAGVERMAGLRELRAWLRSTLGPDEYSFWAPELEKFLSQDRLSNGVLDAYRPDPDFQSVPRLTIRVGDRYLNLRLSATAIAVDKPGKETTLVLVDKIKAAIMKPQAGRDRRSALRWGGNGAIRFLGGLLSLGGRASWSSGKGQQNGGLQKSYTLRAVRSKGGSQVATVHSTFALDATWGRDGEPTQRGSLTGQPGYVQVRLRTKDLDAELAKAARPNPSTAASPAVAQPTASSSQLTASSSKAPVSSLGGSTLVDSISEDPAKRSWWTPTADGSHGAGYGAAVSLGGIDSLYNSLVPYLVNQYMLPPEALGDGEHTPWQVLQRQDPTGHTVNQPGSQYENWRTIIDHINDRYLVGRIDDLMSGDAERPGLPLTLTNEAGLSFIIGLSAVPGTESTFVSETDLWLLNSFSGQDGVVTRRSTAKTKERGVEGNLVGDNASQQLYEGAYPMGGVVSRYRTWREGSRSGETISANVQAAAALEEDSSVFDVELTYRWRAYSPLSTKDGKPVHDGPSVPGSVRMRQPTSYAQKGTAHKPLPQLQSTGDSPLIGITPRAPVSAAGLAQLREQLIQDSTSPTAIVDVLDGLSMVHYKASLGHAWQAGVSVLTGSERGLVRVKPIGTPQILKKVRAYNDFTLESQAGTMRDQDRAKMRGWRAIFGYRSGLASDTLGGIFGTASGEGLAQSADRTSGSYRAWTGMNDMFVVRTAVINKFTRGDGTVVEKRGEVILMLAAHDVLRKITSGAHTQEDALSQWQDPEGILRDALAKQKQAADSDGALRKPPLNIRQGRPWSAVFLDSIGKSPLQRDVGKDALQMGGRKLRTRVRGVMVGLMAHQQNLFDDGKSWDIRSDGEVYRLTIRARVADDASYITEGDRDRLKLYTRRNIGEGRVRRNISSMTGAVTGSLSTAHGDDGAGGQDFVAPVSMSVTNTVTRDRGAGIANNMLTMVGERPQTAAQFSQRIQFEYTLERVTSRVAMRARRWIAHRSDPLKEPAPDRRAGEVFEIRTMYALLAGSRRESEQAADLSGVTLAPLPHGARLHGVHALAAFADALAGRARAVDAGVMELKFGPDRVLTHETLMLNLRQMQDGWGKPGRGVTFNGINTGSRRLDLAQPMTVTAKLGTIRDSYFIKSAELEEYDHGTQGIAATKQRAVRFAGDVSTALTAQVAPAARVGARLAFGGDYIKAQGQGEIKASEHRSWVRNVPKDGIYHIYADVTFHATVEPGTDPTSINGALEFTVDRQDAHALGLTDEHLEAIRDANAKPTAPISAEPPKKSAEPTATGQSSQRPDPTPRPTDAPRGGPTSADTTAAALAATFSRPVIVNADGDCLFHAVLASTGEQGVALPDFAGTGTDLRAVSAARARAMLAGPDGDRLRQLVPQQPADLLVADLDDDQLRSLLPNFWHVLTEQQISALRTSEEDRQRREKAKAMNLIGHADLPMATLKTLLPVDFEPQIRDKDMVDLLLKAQVPYLREHLANQVARGDAEVIDRIAEAYARAGMARSAALAGVYVNRVRESGTLPTIDELVVLALARTDLWNSALGDYVPELLAAAMGIFLIVVADGNIWPINPQGVLPVVLRRSGRHFDGRGRTTGQASTS